ncbi:MAG: polysaccharide biosynthesis C-terminal domain-containing protein [Myxococcota bacterium]
MSLHGGERRYDRELRRNSVMSALGGAGKLLHLLLVFLLTWLFGSEVVGPFLLGFFLLEMATTAVSNAWSDAATIYASHHVEGADADDGQRAALYGVLGTTGAFACGLALALALATQLFGRLLVEAAFPTYAELLPGLYFLAWSLVPAAWSEVAVGALKAAFRMEWDALINGLVKPVGLIATSFFVWAVGGGLTALLACFLIVQTAAAILVLFPLARHFDLRRLVQAVLRPRLDRRVLGFAGPQSLNLVLNRYVTRVDTLMLAGFGFGAVSVAWYGTAALLIGNLRQLRVVFSTAIAPIAARYYATNDREAASQLLGRTSRWIATVAAPIAFAFVVLRDDVMVLLDDAYGAGDSAFVAVLVLPALVGVVIGLAGNLITYAGRSRWNLLNSVVVGVGNTLLNLLLIPRWGMMGAATATTLAVTGTSLLQLAECRWLDGVRLRWRELWQPVAGMAALALLLLVWWDPARELALPGRVALAAGGAAGFLLLMVPLRHPEARSVLRRLQSAAPHPASAPEGNDPENGSGSG